MERSSSSTEAQTGLSHGSNAVTRRGSYSSERTYTNETNVSCWTPIRQFFADLWNSVVSSWGSQEERTPLRGRAEVVRRPNTAPEHERISSPQDDATRIRVLNKLCLSLQKELRLTSSHKEKLGGLTLKSQKRSLLKKLNDQEAESLHKLKGAEEELEALRRSQALLTS